VCKERGLIPSETPTFLVRCRALDKVQGTLDHFGWHINQNGGVKVILHTHAF
jgi:hypothetical protein